MAYQYRDFPQSYVSYLHQNFYFLDPDFFLKLTILYTSDTLIHYSILACETTCMKFWWTPSFLFTDCTTKEDKTSRLTAVWKSGDYGIIKH